MYNDFAAQAKRVLKVSSMIYTFNIDSMPGYGNTVWGVQKKILEQVLVSAKMLLASLEGSVDFVDDEFDILRTDWIYSKYIAAYAALLAFFEHENVLSSTSLMS